MKQTPEPTPAQRPHGPQPQAAELFEFDLLQLANYLFSNRWWIGIGTGICVLLAVIWVTAIRKPIYRANVAINIDLMAEEKQGASAMSSPFWAQDQMIANKIGIVEQYYDSQEFLKFLERFLREGETPGQLKESVILIKKELLRQGIEKPNEIASAIHGSIDLRGFAEKARIDLTGSSDRPMLAAAFANLGSYALTEYNRMMLVQRLKSLKNFLNAQTLQTKRELHSLENELVGLQKHAKIISPDEVRIRVNGLQVDQEAKLIEYDRQYASLNALILETESDLTYFKQLMQENKPASHLYIEQIQRRLEVLRYEKMQNDDSPSKERRIQVDKGIEQVVSELAKQLNAMGPVSQSPWDYVKKIEAALFELKQKRSQARSELVSQQAAVHRTAREFIGLPDVLKKMSEVKRNIDLTTSLYTALMTRLQDTQIKEAAHSNDLVAVSSAEAPRVPSGLGRTKTVMLSLIGGLLLAALPLLLRFVLLPTIRNVKDLRHLFVPIIGAVSWHRGPGRAPKLAIAMQDRFPRLLKEAPNSPEANALRLVRFQLEQQLSLRAYAAGQASKCLIVGSVNPKEGRSFTSANLADLFAASGVRVCVIDLDFSKPGVHEFFPDATVEMSPMTDMFPPACGFKMMRVSDKLTILSPTAKKDNMSELLETREFGSALNALEVIFELIIIDTPPITGHMEPVICSQYADAFLLVINQRRTMRTEVEDSIRVLQSSLPKLQIFGMINFVFDEISQARRKQKKVDRRGEPERDSSQPPPSTGSNAA